MKRHPRVGALALTLLLVLSLLPGPARATEPSVALTVLFTHDTHDHFYPDAANVGGYGRLATALKNARQSAGNTPTITVDAGDFSMGSLFQTVYATDAPELRTLGTMGYDVTTLGNHEFDYRQQGLADMLNAAKAAQKACMEATVSSQSAAMEEYTAQYGPMTLRLPAIVQANYKAPKDPSDPGAQALMKALENYPVTDYTVIERDGMKIAVFGVMGVDSDECAPMSGMKLEPVADAAKRVVAEIKEKVNPTFIICLSHTGTEDGKGEDYELAKAVDGIDLIISGHTHTTLKEPIEVNNTFIVSCGPYTKNLGSITLTKSSGPAGYSSYTLTPLDSSIPSDPDIEAVAQSFKFKVDQNYLSQFDLGYDQVITAAAADFTIAQTGDLIGQAYIDTVKELERDSYVPIAFAVAPDGVIRDRIRSGNVTASQAFDILSLGSGADGSPGYPLISVYLTGKDLKNAFEVDASVSQVMSAAELFGAGSTWTYNPHRMFLDRVTSCSLLDPKTGQPVKIQDDQLYRVIADLYSGQMLGTVKSKSFGILTVTPRDENGNEVTDFETRILCDDQGRELKSWYALASYLRSQDSVVPPSPSKTENASWNPVRLLLPMGLPTLVVLLLGLALIGLVVLIVRLIRRRRNRGGYRPYRG